jgi:hypothetical protein
MNASSQSGSGKRPIHHAFYAASCVSDVRFAPFGAGFFGVRGAGKIRSFAAKQRSTLFCFGLFRRNRPQPGLTNFLSGFFGSDVSTGHGQHVCMAFLEMFFTSKTLKVLQPIVGLIVVHVMDLFSRVKFWHPAFRHNPMNEVFAAHTQVAAVMEARRIRAQLSKNFSAARNSVKMVKESVFDSVNYYAGHGVPFEAVTGNQVLT